MKCFLMLGLLLAAPSFADDAFEEMMDNVDEVRIETTYRCSARTFKRRAGLGRGNPPRVAWYHGFGDTMEEALNNALQNCREGTGRYWRLRCTAVPKSCRLN